jgi:hypothetical protein
MKQEDYNNMMMTPEEGYAFRHPEPPVLPRCPICGEEYSGNGIDLCVECAMKGKE